MGGGCGRFRAAALVTGVALALMHVALQAAPASALTRSQDVAYLGSLTPQSGGQFPRTGFPDGYAPTFTQLAAADIMNGSGPNPLTPFDTLVLVSCDIDVWIGDADFEARVEAFVSGGGKLIMWDTECGSSDYSQFIYPFRTSGFGARGSLGGLEDVEENTLSSTDPASPYYVDEQAVATGTDAAGDANVMVSRDPHWCVDLRATNIGTVAGPVHTYAHLGRGLMIYNGLDADAMQNPQQFDGNNSSGAPQGNEHLGRLWLFELSQSFDPDTLPCSVKVFGITLTPRTAVNEPGTSHTVTARVTSGAADQPGVAVTFTVVSGPNAGTTETITTDAGGRAVFTYIGAGGGGQDVIQATADFTPLSPPGQTAPPGQVETVTVSDTATKYWTTKELSLPPEQTVITDTFAPPTAGAPPAGAAGVNVTGIPKRCTRSRFEARVSTTNAASIQISLDGRRIRTTTKPRSRVTVDARSLEPGRHRLTVVATSAGGRRTRRAYGFSVCAAEAAPAPPASCRRTSKRRSTPADRPPVALPC